MLRKLLPIVFIIALAGAGCESLGENTKKGAGLGALGGAAIGGIIGHQSGHGWEGALIGGASGALLGGIIGNEMDKRQLALNSNHITVIRIAEMAKEGVPEDVIINEIVRTKSKYELNTEIINYLKDNGVGDKVINHMLSTA